MPSACRPLIAGVLGQQAKALPLPSVLRMMEPSIASHAFAYGLLSLCGLPPTSPANAP
jgi:hypothetical protein